MTYKWTLPVFCLICLAQWAVPVKMIAEQEWILREGVVYKFKTAPVDPSDPFRGSYITLQFSADNIETKDTWEYGEPVYVTFTTDRQGFASIASVERKEPMTGDYIQASVDYYDSNGQVFIDYPFDRFYLEESKASQAERVYWESNRNDSTHITYATVRIKNGKAALEDVRINDKSIVDVVRELNKN